MTPDTDTDDATAASPDLLAFPGGAGWDAARLALQLRIDQRPAAVAVPQTVADVVAVIDHAELLGLRLAVHCSGENVHRHGRLDGALLVDMTRVTGVEIDTVARTVRATAS